MGDRGERYMATAGDFIVGQERAGTLQVIAEAVLPRLGSSTEEQIALLLRLGFILGEPIDDLFIRADLPPGWSKGPSGDDHRTTLLRDHRGRARGSIWYKAASYDRYAYLWLESRFAVTEWPGESIEVRDWGSEVFRTVVLDRGEQIVSGGERIVWQSGTYENALTIRSGLFMETRRAAQAEAEAWLDATWPGWRDKAAHWDE